MKGIPYINRGNCGILLLKDINYIECTYRKAVIHQEKRTVSMYISPANLAKYLDDRFNMCLNTLFINFEKVMSLSNSVITFLDGDTLTLSRNCYFKVRRDYIEYLKNIQKTLANA